MLLMFDDDEDDDDKDVDDDDDDGYTACKSICNLYLYKIKLNVIKENQRKKRYRRE